MIYVNYQLMTLNWLLQLQMPQMMAVQVWPGL